MSLGFGVLMYSPQSALRQSKTGIIFSLGFWGALFSPKISMLKSMGPLRNCYFQGQIFGFCFGVAPPEPDKALLIFEPY